MKKYLLVTALLFATFFNAQEKEIYPQDIDKKHEIKANVFSLIALSSFDVSYEYLLSKDSSFGVSLFINTTNKGDDLYFPKKFSLTPYYRWFFTDVKFARGFFVEGFGSVNTYENDFFSINSSNSEIKSSTDFALGVSVGGKFVIKSGFTAEIYLGVGRNLFYDSDNSNEFNIITRGGLSLGYRF